MTSRREENDVAHASQPDLHLPEIHLPEMHMPDIHLGDLKVPDLHVPELHVPDIDVQALTRFGRPAPRRRNLLPWILVGSAGAAAAGWFIATSSTTGPRIRAAAANVRHRIDTMRGRRTWDDDEAVESTERFWANEHGRQQEGSQGGPTTGDAE